MTVTQLCLFTFLASFANILAAQNSKRPNIVFIFADDYGWNDVGYHNPDIYTPTMDKMASEGVKLENYYVQPICTPSRSQFMSGRYQIHTGLQHEIIWIAQPNGLPLNTPTVADMLKKQGYATHAIGKWHLGFYQKEFTPTYRGFDSFYGYLSGSEDYYSHARGWNFMVNSTEKWVNGLDFDHNTQPVLDQNKTYSAHIFAKRAEDLVKEHARYNADQPFFLYLPFQSVHMPLQVPKHYEDRYSSIKDDNRRVYSAMVTCMDEAIGNVTQAFKDAGMYDNTVVIFSADNGGQVLAGGNNWPLRGWKGQLWEGGVRAVGFVHSPLLQARGTTNRALVHVSDWFPTMVGLAGGSTKGLELDGYDQWDAISKNVEGPRKEILHNIDPMWLHKGERRANSSFDTRVHAAVRVGDWKLLTGDPGNGSWIPPPHLSDLTASLPTTYDGPDKNLWLFNIRDDPEELVDLSVDFPHIVDALLKRLTAYNATAVPPRYPPEDPAANPDLHGGVWRPWRD